MTTENQDALRAVLRRYDRLSGIDEISLGALADTAELGLAQRGDHLLDLGSTESRQLFLLEGEIELVAGDGASHRVRHTDAAARGPVSQLRPSRYDVIARSEVHYALLDQRLIDGYARAAPSSVVLVDETFATPPPTELLDDSASHPVMFDVFDDLNRGRIVVPSDPGIAVRVGRALHAPGIDAERVADLLAVCPALALKIMRAAKAGGRQGPPPRSMRAAVEQLGIEQTIELAVHCVLRESLRTGSAVVQQRMQRWSQHALRVAAISAVLARGAGRLDADFAYLVGLLHSIAEPVLLGYADRHADLADPVALENVIQGNRAELGRILLTLWDLPRAVVDAATLAAHWDYAHPGPVDYTDVVLVAQWHAAIGGGRNRRLPTSGNIPAFARFGLDRASPERSLKIIDAAEQAIADAQARLPS